MAKGQLTLTEKYAVQGMLADGKSIDEINTQLNRTGGKAVQNYIVGQLDDILNTVTQVKLDRALDGDDKAFNDIKSSPSQSEVSENSETGNKEISSKEVVKRKLTQDKQPVAIPDDIADGAKRLLRGAGLKKSQISDVVERTHKRLNRCPANSQEFYTLCMQTLNANDMMVSEAEGGREGVKIMTPAASAALDEVAKRYRKTGVSRSARGNMFNPKTGDTY